MDFLISETIFCISPGESATVTLPWSSSCRVVRFFVQAAEHWLSCKCGSPNAEKNGPTRYVFHVRKVLQGFAIFGAHFIHHRRPAQVFGVAGPGAAFRAFECGCAVG